jgi:hypothetical protein
MKNLIQMENEKDCSECIDRIGKVLNHIQNVQRNCYKLGIKLIKIGEIELGKHLIANGQIHDNSKFKGMEFDHLIAGSQFLKEVAKHHASLNPHHPQYWGRIQNMPEEYLAEMVCDCYARSTEFGTSIFEWFDERAPIIYEYTLNDDVYHKIKYYLGLILEPAFV